MAEGDSTHATRPSLLLRLRDPRDGDAWSTFVETYTPLIYGYCRRRGLQDTDAADVAQEVMTQVVRSIQEFEYRPDRGRFRDWFGTVTHNKLADHRRNGQRAARNLEARPDGDLEQAPAGVSSSDWEAEFNDHVLRTALERIRPRFEPATWRAFTLVWRDDRAAAEVARELAIPIDTVYVAKSRVLKQLREEVSALAEDLPLFVPLDS